MTYTLGWRKTFGVLAPSTNTVVEADFARMAVPGVTAHMGRIHVRNADLSSNESFEGLLDQIRDEIDAACQRVLTCEPDYMIMGMSAETFWGGAAGAAEFAARMEKVAGGPIAMGSAGCERALKLYGVRRIGVVTPYQPVADENVRRFFTESGYDVVKLEGLKCPTAVDISREPEDRVRKAVLAVDGPDVEAIVQVGTNLSMVRLADEAQRWLGKPVIAINAATWWMALRDNGIEDKVYGCGDLLENH
jgi:maleate isomerase